MSDVRYGPPGALIAPRYTGVKTFARCPLVTDELAGVDVAIVGVPFDTGTSYRPGARFGPEGIRAASMMLRPYHVELGVDVFEHQSVVDRGDLAVTPGNAERTTAQIDEGLAPLVEAGVLPIVLGGDHSIVLGELRAHARKHGPLGLILIDAHSDTWDQYYGERYFHGTPFRRAVEEGLVDPSRSLMAGLRGSLYNAGETRQPQELGFTALTTNELRDLTPAAYGALARELLGDGPAYLSFDIDVIDPAYAPGTGAPEIAGLSPQEAQQYLHALSGIPFVGYDLVEVAPVYDGPAQITQILAANLAHDFLALNAIACGQDAGVQ